MYEERGLVWNELIPVSSSVVYRFRGGQTLHDLSSHRHDVTGHGCLNVSAVY